jgi:hypothetical protein
LDELIDSAKKDGLPSSDPSSNEQTAGANDQNSKGREFALGETTALHVGQFAISTPAFNRAGVSMKIPHDRKLSKKNQPPSSIHSQTRHLRFARGD